MDIDPEAKYAIEVDGDFQFDSVDPPDQHAEDKDRKAKNEKKVNRWKFGRKKSDEEILDEKDNAENEVLQEPFALRDLQLKIPRGKPVS